MVDMYRVLSKGQYDNDFSFLNYNSSFPSREVQGRNAVYRFRHKQYTGEYARNKNLIARINDVESEIPYKVISVNYFKLLTNKMTDLVFNNEINIKTGDVIRDKEIAKLIERTNWIKSIRKAFKLCTEYGDACIKTYKNGVSSFSPLNCFKVVDESNIEKVKAYVLYEPLYTNIGGVKNLRYMRFEIHFKGKIFECVRDYIGSFAGGTVGLPVSVKYKDRIIPKDGIWYDTGIDDCELISWLSINEEADGVYGESVYQDIQDIVFAIEQRLSINQHLLDNSLTPFLIVGADMIETYHDGNNIEHRRLKLIDGKFLASFGDGDNVKPIELNYNLTNSENMLGILQSFLYEISEMGKTYLSGEYSGNISEETLNNTIKSAIDKGNRLITEMYYSFRDSLYVLCKLNDIDINKEDITIIFNIGRTDDDQKVADICKTLIESGVLSKATTREKYFGYNKEQSDEEEKQIEYEKNSSNNNNDNNNQQVVINDKTDDKLVVNEIDNKDKENKEDKTNENIRTA